MLDTFQERLLITLVEAALRGPELQPSFTWTEQPPGSAPIIRDHPGLREEIRLAKSDLKNLAGHGLLTEQIVIAGSGHFTLTQNAFDFYRKWKRHPSVDSAD